MALTSQDYQSIFQLLSETLESSNLGWVSEQVAQRIEQGHVVEKQIYALRASKEAHLLNNPKQGYTQSSKESSAYGVAEYTLQEQVLLLIDAIQNVIDLLQMEQELAEFFGDSEPHQNSRRSLQFFPTDEVLERNRPLGDEETVTINLDKEEQQIEKIRRLMELLQRLKREVENG